MPSYALTAIQAPAILSPTALFDPTADAPVVAQSLTAGETVISTKFTRNAARLEALGRYGAGAWAVAHGLGMTAGAGLSQTVTEGAAVIDGVVPLSADGAIALTDNTYNYIWLSQAGALVKATSADPNTPPAAPITAGVYLGRVTTSGGARTDVDYSGRLEFHGGQVWRRTHDTGKPGDTPAAALGFWTKTQSGAWFWDGVAYYLAILNGSVGGVLGGTLPSPSFAVDMATQAELDTVRATFAGATTFAVGTEALNAISVTATLKSLTGANLATRRVCRVWLSDVEAGAIAGAAPDGGVVVNQGVVLKIMDANLQWDLLATTGGVLQLTITESTAKAFWLNVAVGGVIGSVEVTFT